MTTYISNSVEETEEFAREMGQDLKAGAVIALFGGLGAGKTAFVRGLAKGLQIESDVSSPTFAIVHEYKSKEKTLCHFDMYRIDSWDDLYSTGFFDYLDEGAVLAIEWSENIENALPQNAIKVHIEKSGESERTIKVEKGE